MEKGKVYKMRASTISSAGCYFETNEYLEKILVPKEMLEGEITIGKEYNVFIYGDKDGRLIGSMKMPKIFKGKGEKLEVVSVTKVGAYLNWGLPDDLFILDRNMTKYVEEKDSCYVMLTEDKYGRTCATMKIGNMLKEEKGVFKSGDKVKGVVYDFNEDIGAFVAVEGMYSGLVPKNHLYGRFEIGSEIEFRVVFVKEDGKIDLTTREPVYMEIEKDAEKIYNFLRINGGNAALNDESSPEEIKKLIGISKKAFKRAVGKLMKEKKIEQTTKGIKII